MRDVLRFDTAWLFHLGDIESPVPTDKHIAAYMANKAGWAAGVRAGRINYDDSDWRGLDLPHDWSVEGEFDPKNYLDNGFLPRGVGWYRRHFKLEESDRGRYLALQFDGVSSHCTVFVNGHVLHKNFCGYTPFTVDISDVARFGDEDLNVVAVRVDATPIEGWWYEGAGIYRHVYLIKAHPLHLAAEGGVSVSTHRKDGDLWHTDVRLTLENGSYGSVECMIEYEVVDPDGVTVTKASDQVADLLPRRMRSTGDILVVRAPKLWSLETPTLYTLRVRLRPFDFKTGVAGSEAMDEVSVPFGYRTIRFDPDHGFFLNDQPLKLKGTCNHQDHVGVGVAVPDSIHAFRIRRLKEMGCNAYRCAHHPPAPELLDACDRLGMLVMDENRTFGSSPEHLAHLRAMVLRDRNHPSVILWSLCNEEAIQGTSAAANIARAMTAEVKRLDPSRPVTAAVSGGILNEDGLSTALEVCGINYQLPVNDAYHEKHPRVPVLAAETHCVFSTRGTYATDGFYFASNDTEKAPWGETARQTWRFVRDRPWLAGLFAWTGFNYRGEPTPHGWPCASSQYGMMDLCGFAKDAFYLHKAFFQRDGAPFVHVSPHWIGREGETVRVIAYGNCDEVELLLNGESLGRKSVDPIEMADWRVAYRPGALRAIGYRGGERVAEAVVETPGPAVALRVAVASGDDDIIADGRHAVLLTVSAHDAQGRFVPDAQPMATFEISGPGAIIGVGNGDPTSHEPDKAARRTLFRGLAQIIVQTATTAGEITITARSDGLEDGVLRFTSRAVPLDPSVPPARRRHFVTDWRMSPITANRPDPLQQSIEQDMNSWERIEPGITQPAWGLSGRGYAIYRATFTPPKAIQTRGGELVFHGIAGEAEVHVGGRMFQGSRARLDPSTAPVTISVLLRSGGAASAGLTGRVEIVPGATNCATS